MIPLGGLLARLLGPLLKNGLSLIGNVRKSLVQSVVVPLELKTEDSAADAVSKKNIFGSGATIFKFSNEALTDIIKIVKSLEESGLLMKGVSKTIEKEVKEKNRGFLDMLAATLAASLLESTLTGKRVVRGGDAVIRAGEGIIKTIIKAVLTVSLMLPDPLTGFEIQKYYKKDAQVISKNESRFNGVYSRNNLSKIKDGAYANSKINK